MKAGPLNLNPGSRAYFQFASRGPRRGEMRSIQLYSGKDKQKNYVTGESIVVKFNISATDVPSVSYGVLVNLRDSEDLSIDNWRAD